MKKIKDYSKEEIQALCQELRLELVENVAKTGGHLSSNLGTVELMVAIHRVFDTEIDRLVFDVGHQCYVHKMLTGRRKEMQTLRQWEGIAGFPKPSESIHDAFIAGHASNSIAVAVGMAKAREIRHESYKVMALLGDGALTGGLAYEGLATAGEHKGQFLVILNDNGMSIAKNVGGVAQHLGAQRLKPQYLRFRKMYRNLLNKNNTGRNIHRFNHKVKQAVKTTLFPCSLFEQMGFTYYGPVDGHNVEELTQILTHAKEQEHPVFLHVRTTKGKSYPPAEENPGSYHGVAPFHRDTGVSKSPSGKNFSKVFGETMVVLGKQCPHLAGITAAMPTGTGLDIFGKVYPDRLFDVGIAEGCATSLAGGMAKQGTIPVFAVYSTFLQRAYDMLIHDLAIERLHSIIVVDRAGLVGEDGETHHGVFDVAFLTTIPGLTLYAPSSFQELRDMLFEAVLDSNHPVAIRYPRGEEGEYQSGFSGSGTELLVPGKHITIVSYGMNINDVVEARKILAEEDILAEVIKINVLSPLDWTLVANSAQNTKALVIVEEVIQSGSIGEKLLAYLAKVGLVVPVAFVNLGDDFVSHGELSILKKETGIDPEGIVKTCKGVLRIECKESEPLSGEGTLG